MLASLVGVSSQLATNPPTYHWCRSSTGPQRCHTPARRRAARAHLADLLNLHAIIAIRWGPCITRRLGILCRPTTATPSPHLATNTSTPPISLCHGVKVAFAPSRGSAP